jgi:hypothetical protein
MGFNNKNWYDGEKPVYTDRLGNVSIGNKKFIGDGSKLTGIPTLEDMGDIQTALTAILGV